LATAESWKPIDWLEGYEISDLGRSRSYKRQGPPYGIMKTPQRTLAQTTNRFGYKVLSFLEVPRYVHRLVLEAFVGPCPEGMQCRHLDGDKTNNSLSNLKWGTPSENNSDKVLHGTDDRGDKHVNRKLSSRRVGKIRDMLKMGTNQGLIADIFGVSPTMISFIKTGKRWQYTDGN